MKRTIMIGAALLGLGVTGLAAAGLLFPSPVPAAPGQAAVVAERRATFAIQNMTCALCPVTVRRAMEGVDGVKSVSVDFGAKTAAVVFDPSRTSVTAIAAASTNAGYPARAISGGS